MPVMVLYKDKSIPLAATKDISDLLGKVTRQLLDESYEVRVVEPIATYNANVVHVEIAFRDFGTWSDELLADYHQKLMASVKEILQTHHISGQFSIYLLPSSPPRSIWAQDLA